jgi:hypothetical protein
MWVLSSKALWETFVMRKTTGISAMSYLVYSYLSTVMWWSEWSAWYTICVILSMETIISWYPKFFQFMMGLKDTVNACEDALSELCKIWLGTTNIFKAVTFFFWKAYIAIVILVHNSEHMLHESEVATQNLCYQQTSLKYFNGLLGDFDGYILMWDWQTWDRLGLSNSDSSS